MSTTLKYNSSAQTLANLGDIQPQCDANGNLKVVINAAPTSGSAITEVTEDAAAAANPVGPQILARRKDTLTSAEVTTDGDVIALNATSKGQLHTFSQGGTAAFTTVASGAASVTIIAANLNRVGLYITNTDANALYLDLSGGTATTTTRFNIILNTNQTYEMPPGMFTNLVTGIWAADGSGSALVTEIS